MIEITIRPMDGYEVAMLADLQQRIVHHRESLLAQAQAEQEGLEYVSAAEALGDAVMAPAAPAPVSAAVPAGEIDDVALQRAVLAVHSARGIEPITQALAARKLKRVQDLPAADRPAFIAEIGA